MSDLMRRSELKESLIHCKELGRKSFEAVLKVIDKQPTIEAVPVVHGEWTHTGIANEWECSNCKSQMVLSDDVNGHPNYCCNCGADMRNLKET